VLFGSQYKSLIGLDITPSSIKLVELSAAGKGYRAECYAAEPTPPNSINERTIIDAPAVGEAIRRAVKRAGTTTKHVAVAISSDLPPRKISLERTRSARELEAKVEASLGQVIPFQIEEVSYDFELLGPSPGDPEMDEVLLVATRREYVDQRVQAVQNAGLIPEVVDVEQYAVENACRLLAHQMVDGGVGRSIAIIDFGASTTTFSVLKDLSIVYTRDFPFGGQQLTEEIMRTYGLSLEEAGRAKKEGGLPGNYQPEVLDPFVDDMTQQVSRSLQFYLASAQGSDQPDQILVCGGCANIPGVADVIASKVGIPTDIGDPLGDMKISTRAKTQGIRRDASALLTALGLALRSFDRSR
jgi:type IV pilus assembly protein PilM